MSTNKNQTNGFTLVEMIAILVVVSIVAAAILGVYRQSVMSSADPMQRMQAIAIAQAYLEEILLQEYDEPPGGPAETGSCEGGEVRATYDDVQDYLCMAGPAAPSDQFGNALASLAAYSVTIGVVGLNIGPGGQQAATQQVTVTVTQPNTQTVGLVGYRANY